MEDVNKEHFMLLYNSYHKDVYARCLASAQAAWPDPEAEAEDMSQEVWEYVWEYILSGRVVESKVFLVDVITESKCRNYRTVHVNHEPEVHPTDEIVTVETDTPEGLAEAVDIVWGLDCTLTRLEKKILQFRYLEGHDDAKVAALLNTSEGVVREVSRTIRNKAATLAAGVESHPGKQPKRVWWMPDYGRIDCYGEAYGPSAIGRQVPNEAVFPFSTEEM